MAWATPHGAYFIVPTGYWVFDKHADRWTNWRNFDGRFFTGKIRVTRGRSALYDHLHADWLRHSPKAKVESLQEGDDG